MGGETEIQLLRGFWEGFAFIKIVARECDVFEHCSHC